MLEAWRPLARLAPRTAKRCSVACGMAATAAILAVSGTALAQAPQANMQGSTEALARAAQNPIAAMISVPFQNNVNVGYGPNEHIQNVLNIQPVVPFSLNQDWNLIIRTILPVISQPGMMPGEGTTFGLGATQFSALLSPAQAGRVIWGAGAVVQAPTTTDQARGSNVWRGGPIFVALTMLGAWVIGGWSTTSGRPAVRAPIATTPSTSSPS